MPEFTDLLRHNRNYRYTWLGQVVSETGDYFNNIAVFSLVMAVTGSGLVVSGVMLSRAFPLIKSMKIVTAITNEASTAALATIPAKDLERNLFPNPKIRNPIKGNNGISQAF